MEAKLTKRVMTLEEVCNLVADTSNKKRGSYKMENNLLTKIFRIKIMNSLLLRTYSLYLKQ